MKFGSVEVCITKVRILAIYESLDQRRLGSHG